MITGVGEVLSGKLLVMDTLTMSSHTFSFKLNEANKRIIQLQDTTTNCAVNIGLIQYDELLALLKNDTDIQLVDVRETEEHEISNIGGINIPLSQFATGYEQLDPDKTVVVYCASGVRSNNAAKQLLQHGFTSVLNLKDGINAFSLY